MSIEGQRFYPGETATPDQIIMLANAYRQAACALLLTKEGTKGTAQAPYRFLAIHAVELYLNAWLLANSHSPAAVRSYRHDFARRMKDSVIATLCLREKTVAHLKTLSETREYLITRYDPALHGGSHLNRLAATLAEVGDKVTRAIDRTPN